MKEVVEDGIFVGFWRNDIYVVIWGCLEKKFEFFFVGVCNVYEGIEF